MNDCIFCKILKGELPCMKIYEDEHTLSFLDIAKDVDGHILVIPKKHVTNILDADGETLSHVMNTVKKIGAHLTENCGYEGMNILNANNECSGQTVFHLHIHLIPRKRDDGVAGFPKFAGAKLSLEEMCERLKMD
ncbi:MAG: HIT family protein [Treponema sp.]